ncbi:MAG: polysaccharide deacetylase family protein [Solirubrobacteraceae bacterium]
MSHHPCVVRHALAPVVPRAAAALELPRRLDPRRVPGVAITFDDGPHPQGTRAMLEVLADAGARATFFMIGEQVQRRPQLAAEVSGRGHAVALHGHRHRLQLRLSARELGEDLNRGIAVLEDAVGISPVLHRPPYGIYSPAGLALVRERGLQPLLWSRWGRDWRKLTTPKRIAARITPGLRAGDVILLHDADFYSATHSHERTALALAIIVAELRRAKVGTVLPV